MTIREYTLAIPVMISARLSHVWYAFLLRFPLPADDKWQLSLRLLRLQIDGFSQVARKKHGDSRGEAIVAHGLHQLGQMWMERQLPLSTSPLFHSSQMADTLMIVLKTLDLPSQVHVDHDDNVMVTTFRCPFLEEARRTGESEPIVCERTCGEIKSLFKGFSEGFPLFIQYKAPKMMGIGEKVCTKEFNINILKAGRQGQHTPVGRASTPRKHWWWPFRIH